ncbi:MAG: biosis protein MshE, partial [Pseudomonadota bacterium]|nr:biosis protein MshE [Pseudomonadota bacterium]
KRSGRKLGRIFVDSGYVTEEGISKALAGQLRIPFIDLKHFSPKPDLIKLLPEAQALFGQKFRQQFGRQPAALGAEDKYIAFLKVWRVMPLAAFRGHGEHASAGQHGFAGFPICMPLHWCELVVIQPGTPQLLVFPGEAHRLDQMQFGAGIGAEADDVARVGRYFGLVENYGEHLSVSKKGRKKERQPIKIWLKSADYGK